MELFSTIASVAGGFIGSNLDSFTGGWLSDSASKASTKRQYNYNSRLQEDNQEFQKYMAENAHQMEMSDLQKAGLNPALTATGSSAGAIAGSSAPQNTSNGNLLNNMYDIVDAINRTRQTNADVEQKTAQTKFIPQQIDNETTSAKANLINAEASKMNAETQRKLAEEGAGGKLFGLDSGSILPSIAATLLPTAGLGIVGMGLKAIRALKATKSFRALKATNDFKRLFKAASSAK